MRTIQGTKTVLPQGDGNEQRTLSFPPPTLPPTPAPCQELAHGVQGLPLGAFHSRRSFPCETSVAARSKERWLYFRYHFIYLKSVADPDLMIRGGRSSRPLDKGGGQSPQIFFGPSGLSLVSK